MGDSFTDRGLEPVGLGEGDWDCLPDYLDLYRRWEVQPWAVYLLDFTRDREQWLAASPEERRQWFDLAAFSHFKIGEARAVEVLPVYLDALPRPEQRIYLACQIADEARHMALFDRYDREVLSHAAPAGGDRPWTPSPAFQELFVDSPARSALEVRANPCPDTLAPALLVSHLLLEGAFAMATLGLVRRVLCRVGKFPGLLEGLTHVHRDECRHALFGIRYLQEALSQHPHFGPTLAARLREILPYFFKVLEVRPERKAALEGLGLDPFGRRTQALSLLRRHLKTIGLALEIQDPATRPLAA